ncbi:MAG TPA: RebB family R body protein [Acetobacteraceae bacterium]|nr:RebB family R body protein [Acetobacteraceae bacterium]
MEPSMAYPTRVKGQITDAVSQTGATLLGNSAAHAMAAVYQVMAHSVGLSMQNAVANQQRMNTLSNGVTARSVDLLYAQPTAVDARAVQTVAASNQLAKLIAELKALREAMTKA